MALNNFARIAFAYDELTRFVYGGAIQKSQREFLSRIKPNASVLILGGGTGWILEELDSLKIPLEVVYIEPSEGMMDRAKGRKLNHIAVKFIHSDDPGLPREEFDNVLAFYFFDLFAEERLYKEIQKVKGYLKPKGVLHCADFEITNGINRFWQMILSKLMHLFFRITANLESGKLLPHNQKILEAGFIKNEERYFYRAFIYSRTYKRSSP